MTQNRRRYKRFLINHPAKLVVNGTDQADCQISNYSEGGLYLAIDNTALKRIRNGQEPLTESTLQAEVQLLEQPADNVKYKVPVRFAFESPEGLGVAFMSPDPVVQRYLSELAMAERKNRVRESLRGQNQAGQPLNQLVKDLEGYLSERIDGYFTQLEEALLSQEDHASQQKQPELRHARRLFHDEESHVKQRFLSQVSRSWEQIQCASETGGASDLDNQSLELVDEDEFEEWTAVVGLSRRMEGNLASTLHNLSQSIAFLTKSPVSNDNNPLSPYRLLWSFKKSLDPLSISVDARRTAYTVFSEQILASLDQLYHPVYQSLEQRGVAVASNRSKRATDVVAKEAEQEEPSVQARPDPPTLIETLASRFRGNKPSDQVNNDTSAQVSSNSAITHALDDMVQGDQRQLTDRIAQSLGGHAGQAGGVTLSPESRQVIEATEQLLQMSQQDPRHNVTTRKILRQVQLPFAKAAIQDPSVLNDPSHHSRELLNNLDQLALFMSANEGSAIAKKEHAKLETVLNSLEASGGKADLNAVSQDISGLLAECKDTFNTNMDLVLSGCQAEQQRSTASQKVRQFLEQELKGSISTLIDQLLRLGWVGLLVQLTRQENEHAKYLKHYQQVLVLLNRAFQGGTKQVSLTPEKWNKIRKVLRKGFNAYPIFKDKGLLLIERIGQSLEKGSKTYAEHNLNRVDISKDYFDQLLPNTTVSKREDEVSDGAESQHVRQLNRLEKED